MNKIPEAKVFDLRCEEMSCYNKNGISCNLASPPDGTFLVKVGRYAMQGDVYRYRVATLRTRIGSYLA
jgi:hypothetical protein